MTITFEHICCTAATAAFDAQMRALQAELAVPAAYYPGFADWLNRVVPELAEGRRSIVLAREGQQIAAVTIAKHDGLENKLCTLWVHPAFRRRHLASALLDRTLPLFAGRDPLISIPECRLHEFRFLMAQRGFVFRERRCGLYHRAVNEYFFFIPLPPAALRRQDPESVSGHVILPA